MNPFELTEIFHETFDPRRPASPQPFSEKEAVRRAAFKVEELVEFLYAASDNNPVVFEQMTNNLHRAIDDAKLKVIKKNKKVDNFVDQVDALLDLIYFTYGSFSLMGLDPEPLLQIVHQANMGKLFPDGKVHYDERTHKVLKPQNWTHDFAPESKIKTEIERQIAVKKRKDE